ncbi:hypothetical protein HK096_010629, partial [Nowakowskiella sp. JEL0078]
MPLGDSITGSPGCWRALLWQKLVNTPYDMSKINFVGTQTPPGCGITYDGDSEGRGGTLVTDTATSGYLVTALQANYADIVLMHYGTNDCWNSRGTPAIINAYTTLLGQMRASNPKIILIIAQIIPMAPSGCTACPGNVIDLNSNIPAWAANYTTAQSPIIVVDQWTGFNTTTDTQDGVHPTDPVGITKIANKFYPAVVQAFGIAGLQPNSTTSSTSTATTKISTTTSTTTTTTTTKISTTTSSTTKTSTTTTLSSTTKATSTTTIKSSTTTPTTTTTATSTSCTVRWGQCGGIGFSGPTSCCGGYTCTYSND